MQAKYFALTIVISMHCTWILVRLSLVRGEKTIAFIWRNLIQYPFTLISAPKDIRNPCSLCLKVKIITWGPDTLTGRKSFIKWWDITMVCGLYLKVHVIISLPVERRQMNYFPSSISWGALSSFYLICIWSHQDWHQWAIKLEYAGATSSLRTYCPSFVSPGEETNLEVWSDLWDAFS